MLQLIPPEQVSSVNKPGGNKKCGGTLVFLQQGPCVDKIIAVSIIKSDANAIGIDTSFPDLVYQIIDGNNAKPLSQYLHMLFEIYRVYCQLPGISRQTCYTMIHKNYCLMLEVTFEPPCPFSKDHRYHLTAAAVIIS